MPFVTFNPQPGVFVDETARVAGQYWTTSSSIRFVRGRPQPVGGYTSLHSTKMFGVCRKLLQWAMNDGTKYIAVPTNQGLYVTTESAATHVSPVDSSGLLSANPFTTTSGSKSVTVSHTSHGRAEGDLVYFAGAAAFNGVTISGLYRVFYVDTNSYTINHSVAASGTGSGGGSSVSYAYFLAAGPQKSTAGSPARTWSLGKWGQYLLANPRDGKLYEWQGQTATGSELVTNGTFTGSASGWTTGTGWAYSSNTVVFTSGSGNGDLTQTIALTANVTYVLTFDLNLSGTGVAIQPKYNGVAIGSSISGTTGNRSFILYFTPTASGDLVFSATQSGTQTATLDNVSVKASQYAGAVANAPARITSILVTPERFVLALGCTGTDGNYNPMLIRNCKQGDNTVWTPSSSNPSVKEYQPLTEGSRLVGGIVGRQESYIFTDTALYVARYNPDPTVIYSYDLIATGCGLSGPNAAAFVNGALYWFSNNGNFYRYAGGTAEAISCPMLANIDSFRDVTWDSEIIGCGLNTFEPEVFWVMPGSAGSITPNKTYKYNIAENCWDIQAFGGRSAFDDASIFGYPISFFPELHNTSGETNFGLYGGYICKDDTGQTTDLAGSASWVAWSITSGYFSLDPEGNQNMDVLGIVPDFDDVSASQLAITVATRDYPNSSTTRTKQFTGLGTTDTRLDMRAYGREMQIRISTSGGAVFARLGAIRLEVQPAGERR